MTHHASRPWVRRTILCLSLAAALLGEAPVEAETPSPPPSDLSAARKAAQERFDRSLQLWKQQLFGPALAEAEEARRLYPSWGSTLLVARCLKALGRFDESLDMYASLVRDYEARLKDDKHEGARYKAVLQEIEDLRKLVGTIEIEGSEPEGAIVVDGQARGFYPLLEPLRVPSGSHIVRVYKQGHEPFETRIEVAGGTRKLVMAKLPTLLATGTLRVVESLGREVDVIVDGFPVGKTPLTVPFAPGKHSVLLRGEGDLGTAPATVEVRIDEIAELRVEAEVFRATLKVVPTPFDALVSIDSVLIGRGGWDGHVRAGGHSIEVAAEGFLPEKQKVLVLNNKRAVVEVPLERDPKSPFWRAPPPPPHFLVDLGLGIALAPSPGGDITSRCTGDCQASTGLGSYFVLRGGYELSSRLSFGLVGGQMSLRQSIEGRDTELNVVGFGRAQGSTDHSLSFLSYFGGAWMGYGPESRLPVRLRLSAGGMLAAVSDARQGRFSAQRPVAGAKASGAVYSIGTAVESRTASFVFVTPEVRIGLPLKRGVEVFVGLEVPILFAVKRPAWSQGHGVNARSDGYGYFDAEALVSTPLVSFVPSVGSRFDL